MHWNILALNKPPVVEKGPSEDSMPSACAGGIFTFCDAYAVAEVVRMKASYKNLLTVAALVVCCLVFLALTYFAYTHTARTAAAQAVVQPQVLLDAGHGGEDGGTVGRSAMPEKDINLDIAKRLEQKLTEQGCQVFMTRNEDVMLGDSSLSTIRERKVSDLHKRLEILQAHPDALFISIHQNHFSDGVYSGAQVFYSQNNPESLSLAESVRSAIVTFIQPENKRQNKPAGKSIYLLWNAQTPAVLVECGFLSNASEAALLNQEAYRQKMADAIASGTLTYIQEKRGQNGEET